MAAGTTHKLLLTVAAIAATPAGWKPDGARNARGAWTPTASAHAQATFSQIGQDALNPGFAANFVRALCAGFLIATMVWLLPGSGEPRLWIVIIIAWVVGVGAFAHVIAGSSEGLYVVFRGERPIGDYVFNFLLPAFLGNSVGARSRTRP